jgi:hypothetical protein
MNEKNKATLIGHDGKRQAPWKSSLYEEPLWVSVAWILGPVLFAGAAIYLSVR